MKHSIALLCLLSGGEDEDRKWADGASVRGKGGDRRDGQRLRKMQEKGTDDWRDRKREDGVQQAWTYDGEREERRQIDTCLLRADKAHYDRIDADKDGEKCEEEE